MSARRKLGEALKLLGLPSTLACMAALESISRPSDNLLRCLWSVPLAILSAPLLPLSFRGESLVYQCDKEDFLARTQALPHVYLSKQTHADAAYIEQTENGDYLAQPFYDHYEAESFETEADARDFLENELNLQEVVLLDYPEAIETYWIRKSPVK